MQTQRLIEDTLSQGRQVSQGLCARELPRYPLLFLILWVRKLRHRKSERYLVSVLAQSRIKPKGNLIQR